MAVSLTEAYKALFSECVDMDRLASSVELKDLREQMEISEGIKSDQDFLLTEMKFGHSANTAYAIYHARKVNPTV